MDVPHPFRGNQNRELAQQWLEKLNDQWELQRFLQNCHEVRWYRLVCCACKVSWKVNGGKESMGMLIIFKFYNAENLLKKNILLTIIHIFIC